MLTVSIFAVLVTVVLLTVSIFAVLVTVVLLTVSIFAVLVTPVLLPLTAILHTVRTAPLFGILVRREASPICCP